MAAVRTQIYLTVAQRRLLDRRAARERKSLAEVVRDAVDAHLTEDRPDIDAVLSETFGALPAFEAPSRAEWDRGYG